MIRDIVKDTMFLCQPSSTATSADLDVATDLVDTLVHHHEGCVGLAANMIGVAKRIIVVQCNGHPLVLFNPKIIKQSTPYSTEEGCLSLEGVRPTKRYRIIKLEYQNEKFQTRYKVFEDYTAQIIQHEIDHCNGILI
ncbi:MAG: peptide deformylase [Eubacteriales bacterium]